jgi:hypothetical protein
MTLRNQIIEQLGGRLFTATFTKLDGSTRQAYGQIVRDDRLTDDHPNVITFIDYSIAKEMHDAGKGNVRRMKLEAGTMYTIKSGKTIISNAS